MGGIVKKTWWASSIALTALSLISIAHRYTSIKFSILFLDVAHKYSETLATPFQILGKLTGVHIPIYLHHAIVIYLLFGAAFMSLAHVERVYVFEEGPYNRFTTGFFIAFWPYFLSTKLGRTIRSDVALWIKWTKGTSFQR